MKPLLLFVLAACLAAADGPIAVVTGSPVVDDLTRRIAGDHFAVSCLIPAGVDPHHYQPAPDDARRLAGASLVVLNGLGFEGWFDRLAGEAGFKGAVVVASAGIVPLPADGHDHHGQDHDHDEAEAVDPHVFHAPNLAVRCAENIRDGLVAADPAGADGIRARAATLIAELRRLDSWARGEIARIPPRQRVLVVHHAGLGYFAREYGFRIRAIATVMEDGEPAARQLAQLVGFIRDQGVRGVFPEAGKQARLVEQVAQEAGVRVGPGLLIDGLGPAGSATGTYEGMFKANVAAIVSTLE